MLGEFAVKITLQSLRVEGFLKFSPAPEYAIRAARHPKQLRAASLSRRVLTKVSLLLAHHLKR